jgi:tRNA-Thr(GGU) m(6)t(6)A37 methyltransferase TsaA
MANVVYQPIGVIHTPLTKLDQMPIQPTGEASAAGSIEIFPAYSEGLKDVDGFSHLILLYHLHEITSFKLIVVPFLDTEPRGVFSTRAPVRPNPIGISVVKLISVKDNWIQVDNLDMLDGTPLLDLKPYIPDFDAPAEVRIGWLEKVEKEVKSMKSDDRFS